MFHPSSRPHLALLICCSVAALLLSFLLVAGWRWHLDQVELRLTMVRAAEALRKNARPAPPPPAVESAVSILTAPPVVVDEALKLTDLARPQEDPLFSEAQPLILPVQPARALAAEELLQRFLQAETWQDKVPLVVNGGQVRDAMRAYYEIRHQQDPATMGPARQDSFRINNTEVLLYSYASTRPGNATDVALIARPGEPFKVDWESFVGASEMGWPEFKKERPIRPQLFRVFAQFDDYYNYEFSDEKKLLSVHLTSPDGLYFIYGFCERGSVVGRTLETLMAAGAARMALTLRLAFSPQAESDHCVHITGVVANRWLLVP